MRYSPNLSRQVLRYERRISELQRISDRITLLRIVLFFSGGASIWSASAWLGAGWTWTAAILFSALFSAAVAYHRRIDRWQLAFKAAHDLHAQALSRWELDWTHIPEPPLPPDQPRSSLDVDLDLSGPRSLHTLVDTSVSRPGSLKLANWLTQTVPDMQQVGLRQALIQELSRLNRFRFRLLVKLRQAPGRLLDAERLLDWLRLAPPAAHMGWRLLAAIALLLAAGVLLVLNLSGVLERSYYWLALAGYAGLYTLSMQQLNQHLSGAVDLARELEQIQRLLAFLEQARLGDSPYLEQLLANFRQGGGRPSRLLQRVKWVCAGVGLRSNPFIALGFNLVLPWDFLFAWLATRMRQRVVGVLPGWLETWVELEALVSLANFAALHPDFIYPVLDPDASPVFEARALGHPLLPASRRVTNDVQLPQLGALALITGSNMAGKSTFIRTIGINLCLAYAGAPVCALALRSRPFHLYSCIRISDSLGDGISYFYAEVKRLKGLLEIMQVGGTAPVLYLIDEIFRGTNNRERLLGSQAYIRTLLELSGAGFLATHDLELARLAEDNSMVTNFHFSDRVEDGRLVFDYLLKPGASPSTNALKIMHLEGLPVGNTNLEGS